MTRRLYRVRTRSAGTTAWRITDTEPTPELLQCLEFEPLGDPLRAGRALLLWGLACLALFWLPLGAWWLA